MPYSGIKPGSETEKKLERCVEQVLAKHEGEDFDKSNAIAICRKSMEASAMHGLTLLPVTEADLKQWGHNLTAEAVKGELVKATNVVLAHAERNANGDGITAENIATLASSLNLKPLDLDHAQTEVIGFFVNPRQQDWGDVTGGELATDLVVFAGRFPEASGDLQTGKRFPSIEARSSEVKCSVCDKWFQSTADYCEHLQPLLLGSKLDPNVTRWHKNMRAIGGGAVFSPAGAETTFGDTFMVVAHVSAELGEGKGVGGPRQGVGGTDKCVCSQCGYEAEHERGTPCAEMTCPKCGAAMGGSITAEEIGPEELVRRIRDSFYEKIERPQTGQAQEPTPGMYVKEVRARAVIVETSGGLFAYPYSLNEDGGVVFGKPEKVEIVYQVVEGAKSPKKPYGDVLYADPGYQKDDKKRYPIDTEKHIRAAWNYINKSKNSAKYSAAHVKSIKAKIIAAWKRVIDKKGPPSAAEANEMGKAIIDVLAQEEIMPEELQEQLETAQARIVELEATNTELEAKVQEHVAEAQAFIVKSRVAALAASGMSEDSLKQINDQLVDMDDTVFDMLAEMQKALSAKPAKVEAGKLTIGDEKTGAQAPFSVFDVEEA